MPAAPRQHARITLFVLSVAVTAYSVLVALVGPVLATIQHDLHTNQTTVTWILTAYLLSTSVFTPIMGRVGDMFGKRRVLIVTMGALALGSFLAAIAPNIEVMIAARAIQGVGGGVVSLSFGIVRDEYPRLKVPGAVGVIASVNAAGAAVGVVLAGPIVGALDYHWLFWFPLILTVIATVATCFFVPESPIRTPGRISWAPVILLPAALVSLLLGVSQAPSWGWGSRAVITLIIASVILGIAWVKAELRATTPLIDMRMMRLPAVWTTNVVSLLVGVSLYAEFVFLPQFVQTPRSSGYGFGASITAAGLIMLPQMATMTVGGFACGPLARRCGAKPIIVFGSALCVASMLLLTFAHGTKPEVYGVTTLQGLGYGLLFPAMATLIVASVPQSQTGVASGMNTNIRTIGGAIGAALTASIVSAHPQASGFPRESGYVAGFTMFAIAAALAAVVALIIPSTRRTAGWRPQNPANDEAEIAQLAIFKGQAAESSPSTA